MGGVDVADHEPGHHARVQLVQDGDLPAEYGCRIGGPALKLKRQVRCAWMGPGLFSIGSRCSKQVF